MRGQICRRVVLHNDLGISDSFWVKAWFLAELFKGNAHGYELINSLSTIFPQEATQTSSVMGNYYRLLRELELLGLVNSSWDTSGSGPARLVSIELLKAPGDAAGICSLPAIATNVPRQTILVKSIPNLIVIDGCHNSCAKKILEANGIKPSIYINLEYDLGGPFYDF
jgi:Transcriptional regulator PadR-like family./DGC domain.